MGTAPWLSLMDLTSLISDLERKISPIQTGIYKVALNQQEARTRLTKLEDKRKALK